MYSDSFVSALGANSSGGGGGGADLGDVWDSLTNQTGTTPTSTTKIAVAHIPDISSTYGYAKTSQLGSYLPLSGGNMTGNITFASNTGFYAKDTGGTSRLAMKLDGTDSLLIGYGTSIGGSNTYIDGNTVYIRYGTSHTTGITLASDGAVTVSRDVTALGYNAKFDVDTSREIGLGWLNTSGTRGASVTYHNTAQNIIINPIGSSDTWNDAVGKYSLIVGNNKLTYNTCNILRSDNFDNYALPLTGGTMSGSIKMDAANKGYYLVDSAGVSYPALFDNGGYLCIGANATSGTHHTGSTYISAGSGEVYIIRLVNNSRTTYKNLDTGNTYVSSGKGYINGTEITTISGNSASTTALKNLYNSSTRPTSANLTHITNGGVQHFKATGSMTTGKPVSDAHILHFHWDGESYDAQMAITTAVTPTVQYRTNRPTEGWSSWITALTSSNYSLYALPLSGGTLSGNLFLRNNVSIYGYDTEDAYKNIFGLNSLNNLVIGWDIRTLYNTYLCGNNIYFNANGSTSMFINSSGNVGIGTTTPSYKLHVQGQIGITAANSGTIRLVSANSTNYIQSGNAAFDDNADMIIGGYNATTGTNLNLQFNVVKATSVLKVKEYLTLGYGGIGIYLTSSGINWHNSADAWTKSIMSFASTGATTINGNLTVSGEVTASSDARNKNIISNTKFNVRDIASARSIIYEWNDGRDKDNSKKIHGGSIAQDWLGKADSFLMQDEDGFYSINYGALALCSAITIAREVVRHDDEITRLKKEVVKLRERVAELEERRIA